MAADPQKEVPMIDLSQPDTELLVQQIADACAYPGFFQIINHGISPELMASYREQCRLYFDASRAMKVACKRNAGNSRGYFDDELTKQKRDWKECLDFGVPGSRDWNVLPDDAPENACLDGYNQFPPAEILPDYRRIVIEFFEACAELSHRLVVLMAKGLGKDPNDPFLIDMKERHSSYLRSNYYPPCTPPQQQQDDHADDISPLGISPHKDAGFLTVLQQDDNCHSLQVLDKKTGEWMSVTPIPCALTINTGDMAQIWSNDRYHAPLHRVLTNASQPRYSEPFFYNPGYNWLVKPIDDDETVWKYDPILWGYFRAVRFAGDLTDLGVEIQVEDFKKERVEGVKSHHLAKQQIFMDRGLANQPFDVNAYRDLLVQDHSQ